MVFEWFNGSVLVSACLLGKDCKYNGGNNFNEGVNNLSNYFNLVPVCPEKLGGLSIPRSPAEIQGSVGICSGEIICDVRDKDGKDVSEYFIRGAKKTLEIAMRNEYYCAILKSKSPSCGSDLIYDGSFSGRLVEGNGIAAGLLNSCGIEVFDEWSYRSFFCV